MPPAPDLPDDLQRPLDESAPPRLRPATPNRPDIDTNPATAPAPAPGRAAAAGVRQHRSTRPLTRWLRAPASWLRTPVRGLRRLGPAAGAWAQRPGGQLTIPVISIAMITAAAGITGGVLVPTASGAPAPAESPPTAVPRPPALDGLTVPVPTAPPGFGATDPPGASPGPSAVRAEALRGWAEDVAEVTGVPVIALQAYGYAELVVSRTHPGCQLSWTTLAAIGRVESGHGSAGGAELLPDGQAVPHIIGAPLDGGGARELIPDTDGGELDGDEHYDRAVGPMQFIPETWRQEAVDATGDGIADVHNIHDAALAAANYLCRHGRDLTTAQGWWQAVLAYNNVMSYAEAVFAAANEYGQRSRA